MFDGTTDCLAAKWQCVVVWHQGVQSWICILLGLKVGVAVVFAFALVLLLLYLAAREGCVYSPLSAAPVYLVRHGKMALLLLVQQVNNSEQNSVQSENAKHGALWWPIRLNQKICHFPCSPLYPLCPQCRCSPHSPSSGCHSTLTRPLRVLPHTT